MYRSNRNEDDFEIMFAEWLREISSRLKNDYEESTSLPDRFNLLSDFKTVKQRNGLDDFIKAVYIMAQDEFVGDITQWGNCIIFSFNDGSAYKMEISRLEG